MISAFLFPWSSVNTFVRCSAQRPRRLRRAVRSGFGEAEIQGLNPRSFKIQLQGGFSAGVRCPRAVASRGGLREWVDSTVRSLPPKPQKVRSGWSTCRTCRRKAGYHLPTQRKMEQSSHPVATYSPSGWLLRMVRSALASAGERRMGPAKSRSKPGCERRTSSCSLLT